MDKKYSSIGTERISASKEHYLKKINDFKGDSSLNSEDVEVFYTKYIAAVGQYIFNSLTSSAKSFFSNQHKPSLNLDNDVLMDRLGGSYSAHAYQIGLSYFNNGNSMLRSLTNIPDKDLPTNKESFQKISNVLFSGIVRDPIHSCAPFLKK